MRLMFALAITLMASPAFALETFVCADEAGEVSVEYDYQYDDKAQPIKRVQMQIEGDVGISTDPAHPDYSGEYIGPAYRSDDFLGIDIQWKSDGGHDLSVMKLRLVQVEDGPRLLQTGGLSVDAGGVWAITCKPSGGGIVAW